MLAALLFGLLPGFMPDIHGSWSSIGLDMRVLATFLAAMEIWIQYAWAVIFVHWRYSLRHNGTYFLLAGTVMCLGFSVTNQDLWLVWAGLTCIGAALALSINLSVVAEQVVADKTEKAIRGHSRVLIVLVAAAAAILLDGGLNPIQCLIPGVTQLACLPATAWQILFTTFALVCITAVLIGHGVFLLPSEQKTVEY